jgi:hypothetical protein
LRRVDLSRAILARSIDVSVSFRNSMLLES